MVNVQINGQERTFGGDASMPLLWYLRDELGLTGTKFGCGVALCGACTVHINGEAVRACGIQMSEVAGKKIVTIEGLDANGKVIGQMRASGLRPLFTPKLEAAGFNLPPEMFSTGLPSRDQRRR